MEKRKLKPNQIWNRYICPAINYTVYGIGILLLLFFCWFGLSMSIIVLG